MKKKTFLDKLFSSKKFNIIISLLLAVTTWFIVSVYVDPERTETITKIPVDFSYNAATYESQGLDILSKPQTYVTVDVVGDGIVINNITADDFTVYPLYSQVRGPGTYELPLERKYKKSGTDGIIVKNPSPSFVTVKFDKVADKKMAITVNPLMIDIEQGYYLDTPIAAPAEVTLHGPETVLNRVAKVVANVSVAGVRKESAITSAQLELQDKDGNVISLTDNHITMDTEQVEVRLNILEERDIPMKVEFINVPNGFDVSILHMQLSEETLRVAGPANLWDTLDTFVAGYIDLTTFELKKEFTFPIKLPDGFINRDNLLNVTATFNTEIEKLSMKLLNVNNVQVSGTPKGVKLEPLTNARINNVQLIGPESVLEDLTSDNLLAQINASDLSLVSGQQVIAAKILIPGYSKVFATGSYTLICETTVE